MSVTSPQERGTPADATAGTLASPTAANPTVVESTSGSGRVTSVFRIRDFRMMFVGAAVSKFGSQISYIAVPLVAVLALQAPAAQVGLLGAAGTVAPLVIGLPAGVWVDRMRRRRIMVSADLARFLLFGSVPLAWWLGMLTMYQLYIVAVVAGAGTVFFDVAAQSYLPHLVDGRDNLVDGNAKLSGVDAASRILGRGIGGSLVGLLSAPMAIILDAFSYLWSAICIGLIRKREPAPHPRRTDAHLARETIEGLGYVLGDARLRAIALSGSIVNFFISMIMVMLPVLFARQLGLSAGAIGFFLAIGGVGALLGTLTAPRLARWLGYGQTLWITAAVVAPTYFLIPLAQRGFWLYLAGFGYLLMTFKTMSDNVIQVSFRQRITTNRLLGRMNATMQFLLLGSVALGSMAGGVIGQYAGSRAALWVGVSGVAIGWLPTFLSPLRRMRNLPAAATD